MDNPQPTSVQGHEFKYNSLITPDLNASSIHLFMC